MGNSSIICKGDYKHLETDLVQSYKQLKAGLFNRECLSRQILSALSIIFLMNLQKRWLGHYTLIWASDLKLLVLCSSKTKRAVFMQKKKDELYVQFNSAKGQENAAVKKRSC